MFEKTEKGASGVSLQNGPKTREKVGTGVWTNVVQPVGFKRKGGLL